MTRCCRPSQRGLQPRPTTTKRIFYTILPQHVQGLHLDPTDRHKGPARVPPLALHRGQLGERLARRQQTNKLLDPFHIGGRALGGEAVAEVCLVLLRRGLLGNFDQVLFQLRLVLLDYGQAGVVP